MTDTNNALPVRKVKKKELRKLVYEKLAGALAEYTPIVNGKKFESKLKKASKLFAVDIARATNKNEKQNKKKAIIGK